jgi:hypothetical protein
VYVRTQNDNAFAANPFAACFRKIFVNLVNMRLIMDANGNFLLRCRGNRLNGFDFPLHFFSQFRLPMQFENGPFALGDFLIACNLCGGIARRLRPAEDSRRPLAKEERP